MAQRERLLDAGHRCWAGPECVGTRTCWRRIWQVAPVHRLSRLRAGNAQGAQAGIVPFLRGNVVFCGPVVEHPRGRNTVFYRGPNSPRWLWITPGAPRRGTISRETRVVAPAGPPTALASPTTPAAPATVAFGHPPAAVPRRAAEGCSRAGSAIAFATSTACTTRRTSTTRRISSASGSTRFTSTSNAGPAAASSGLGWPHHGLASSDSTRL